MNKRILSPLPARGKRQLYTIKLITLAYLCPKTRFVRYDTLLLHLSCENAFPSRVNQYETLDFR